MKQLNARFYNIDYIQTVSRSKAPPTAMVHYTIGTLGSDLCLEEDLREVFPSLVNEKEGYIAKKDIPELERLAAEHNIYVDFSSYVYVTRELSDGRLFSGWRTGRRTSITKDDLPEWYVYLSNYKRHGYLDTKHVTDLVYVPSPFHNHAFKDDFLYLSYDGDQVVRTGKGHYFHYSCDEYVFGNDILSVIFGVEKYSPDVFEKVAAVKAAMVEQYNAYVEESQRGNKRITRLEELRA